MKRQPIFRSLRAIVALTLLSAPAWATAPTQLAEWDASPFSTFTQDFTQRGGIDFTHGGADSALAVWAGLLPAQYSPHVTVYSGDADASDWTHPKSSVWRSEGYIAPFADFVPVLGNGADFTAVTRIELTLGVSKSVKTAKSKVIVKSLTTMDALLSYTHIDNENDGEINPGDTIEYTLLITNTGSSDNTNVQTSIFTGGQMQIIAGTVSATNGSVLLGNTPGDANVSVKAPFLGVPPCSQDFCSITFRATVRDPFDTYGRNVCVQAAITSDNAPTVYSDDPNTPSISDSTCFNVVVPGSEPCQTVILSESFESGSSFTKYNLDNRTPDITVSYVNDAWVYVADEQQYNNKLAASTSFYSPPGRADDWLVTYRIYLSKQSRLRWYARSNDFSFRDGYEVWVSRTGNTPADFTGAPVYTIAEEINTWQLRTVDLAAAGYADEYVYIAFRNHSTDKNLLLIDGIEVCDITSEATPACPPQSLYNQDPNRVQGTFNSAYTDQVNLARLDSFSGLSSPISTITWWGVAFDSFDGSNCDGTSRTFRIELLQDNAGAPGASVFDTTAVVTGQPTGRSIKLGFSDQFFDEYAYSLTVDPPVTLAQGWLRVQGFETGSCYFSWLASPTGDAHSYSAPPDLSSILDDSYDYAFCLSSGGDGDPSHQTADQNDDYIITLSELLRVIQFYNSGGLHCANNPGDTEDGYVPGPGGNQTCAPYDTDYNPQDWLISLSELLRVIQFYNSGGYHYCPSDGTEDGFCAGL